MLFQAVGPEDPKESGPKLVVQDGGTSSLFALADRSRGLVTRNLILFRQDFFGHPLCLTSLISNVKIIVESRHKKFVNNSKCDYGRRTDNMKNRSQRSEGSDY